jgi:hypothetical protein
MLEHVEQDCPQMLLLRVEGNVEALHVLVRRLHQEAIA